MTNPILSVCIRTYNQEKYIVQVLDSVLAQKTIFAFEVIVCDDCSTDNTLAILQTYAEQYPQIRLLSSEKNIGGPANLRRVIESSAAKYITCLDGDDYYIDDYKLQKQVNFLENNPIFAACFHNTLNVDANDNALSLFNPLNFHAIHPASEFITERWFVPVHSAVLRREYIAFPDWYLEVPNDDFVVHLSVALHGDYYYMPDVMVAYRHHGTNTSNMYSNMIYTNQNLCRIIEGFRDIYPSSMNAVFDQSIAKYKSQIAFDIREQKQPWRKYFRLKTYKRMIKRLMLRK